MIRFPDKANAGLPCHRGPVMFASLGSEWSPAALFKDGEQGWLVDLSLESLFQDAAGTIPLTEPGQPVGLVLDKSKGLVLGPENVPTPLWAGVVNGTSTLPTGWTNVGWYASSNGTYSVSGDTLTITVGSNGRTGCYFPMATVPGYSYRVVYADFGGSAMNIRATSTIDPNSTSPARYQYDLFGGARSLLFVAISTTTYISVTNYSTTEGASGYVTGLSVREVSGNHWRQPTALNRPIYQVDAEGNPYLSFNGTNQWMQTAAFDWGSDEVMLTVGNRRISDAATGIVFEYSQNVNTNNGSYYYLSPTSATLNNITFLAKGTLPQSGLGASAAGLTVNTSGVVTGLSKISGDSVTTRINGEMKGYNVGDLGGGGFGDYPLFIGSRGGTSLFFNGNLYPSLGINRLLNEAELTSAEDWVAKRTGGLTP